MTTPRAVGAAVIIAAALLLAACTSTSTTAVRTAPATTAEPAASHTATPTPSDETTASATPAPEETAVGGAYLEYTDEAIAATPGAKALFFHASWCPQCRALDDDLRARGVPDGLTVFQVDYDSRTDLRQEYGVTIQTTVVFVDDDGEAISSSVLYDDPSLDSLLAAMP